MSLRETKTDSAFSSALIALLLLLCSCRHIEKYVAFVNIHSERIKCSFESRMSNLMIDSLGRYRGNPEGVGFKDSDSDIRIQFFIGTQNPPGSLKYTFDFNETYFTIFEEIDKTEIYELIDLKYIYIDTTPVTLVHYIEYKQLEKVESQIKALDSIIVNIQVYKPNNSITKWDIATLAEEIVKSIKLEYID